MGFKQVILDEIVNQQKVISDLVYHMQDPTATVATRLDAQLVVLRHMRSFIEKLPESLPDKLNNVKIYDGHIVWKRPIGEGYHVNDMIPLDQLMKENEQ